MSNEYLNKLFGTRESETEKLITEVANSLRDKDKQIESLKQKNHCLKSEHYKDEEIVRLEEQIKKQKEAMNYGFPITKEQHEKIMELCRKHEWEKHGRKGTGYFNYCFCNTEIGTFGWMECCDCKEEIMFLEAGKWLFG